ncbi:ABC transporter ATP-binding protein [Vagococcus intermedius]|uniref:Putative hemin import ATP-binding protein HrtA n=1 Tax=Vagococcus intermedius TaxID=2991418 RepID=A0AAF0CT77_9ENTE|nr:ABC transporter ATP-binding protein [Vagococcus intermedius]WEG72424.1 ABC transporter ATP-binding protein [Vagococcus intermedius]WEG74511.1 ABC transporter ATP-binding protein [Vagococcus intermedius]
MSLLELSHVTKTFEDGNQKIEALKATSFSVDKGEFVAVIGPSGSGKSTFLTIAGGLQSPSTGEVLVNGHPLSTEKEKVRASLRLKEIGFILQASNLIPFLTVSDQFVLVDKIGEKNEPKMDKMLLLKDLGIADLAQKYPADLSGGQRQRVAIARALYHNPSVILADEPTASLDSEKAFEVVEILARETKEKQKATVMVTHDTRLLDYCDKVYEMRDGELSLVRSNKN